MKTKIVCQNAASIVKIRHPLVHLVLTSHQFLASKRYWTPHSKATPLKLI